MDRPGGGKPAWKSASNLQPAIAGPLSGLGPLRLDLAACEEERRLWNALVDRRHYLGCGRSFGERIRYFPLDSVGRRLGCMLFEFSTLSLPRRGRRVGRVRSRHRYLAAFISRFLALLWVSAKNLSSCAPGMARRRLGGRVWLPPGPVQDIRGRRAATGRPASEPPTGCASARPPAASSVRETREKLDEAAFKRLHTEILDRAPAGTTWKRRRVLAVDGNKTGPPRPLTELGFVVLAAGKARFYPSKRQPLPGMQKIWEGMKVLWTGVNGHNAMREWIKDNETTELSMIA